MSAMYIITRIFCITCKFLSAWPRLAGCAAAQVNDCPSPDAVLHRYIEAVGGKAVNDVQTRIITTHESNKGYGAEPENYVYRFKWKAPDKVVAASTPYLLNHLPVHYPNGAFIYDGDSWSDFMGHKSRMYEHAIHGNGKARPEENIRTMRIRSSWSFTS